MNSFEFINHLCTLLEEKGLGQIPEPTPLKKKKPREPRIYKPGDKVKIRYLKDLPLPAHLRLPIFRRNKNQDEWEASTIEIVVMSMSNTGYYTEALVEPRSQKAYFERSYARKDDLANSIFLGKWNNPILENKRLKLNFLRKPWRSE